MQLFHQRVGMRMRDTVSPVLPALFLPAHNLALKVKQVGRLEPTDDNAPKRSSWREHASEMRMRRQGGVVLQKGERALRNHT